MKFLRYSLLILLLSFSLLVAQGAPEQIQDALALFNQEQGTALTLNDLYWEWEQTTADDSSLGCPKAGETYTPGRVVVYRVLFTYNNTIYDYRVSADRTITRSCGGTPVGAPTATLPPNVTPTPDPLSNRLCPESAATLTYIRTRLAPNIEARVIEGGAPNRLRAEASTTANVLAEIPPGAAFDVLSGPVCDAEGYVWWQVDYNGTLGYTAEGQGSDYYIEPLPPTDLPADLPVIETGNAALVGEVGKLQGNFSRDLLFMPDGKLLTVGEIGSEGAWLYDSLQTAPRIVTSADLLTAIAYGSFGSDKYLAMYGGEDGAVRVWDVAADADVVERVFLNGHDDPIDAIAFKPDGTLMASVGGLAYTSQNDSETDTHAILLWNVGAVTLEGVLRGHTDAVTGLVFVGNDRLISSSLDGTVRLWNTEDFTQMGAVTAEVGATSLALHPEETLVVAGYADGSITVYTLPDLTPGVPLIAHGGAVSDVAFSFDGNLLATSGSDGTVALWDAASLVGAEENTDIRTVLPGRHEGAANAVSFSPDGRLLASIGADRIIRLWGIVSAQG
jgi:WD40 repeat protein